RAMAGGALTHSHASLSVSITGIAGPDGGTPEKPVGLVHFAALRRDEETHHERVLFGDLGRAEIRRRSVERAIAGLRSLLGGRRRTLTIELNGTGLKGSGVPFNRLGKETAYQPLEQARAESVSDKELHLRGVGAERTEVPAVLEKSERAIEVFDKNGTGASV